MRSKIYRPLFILSLVFIAPVLFSVAGCSSGSNSSDFTAGGQTGNVSLMVQDAATDDWATIGVRVLGIALNPQGGGSAVTVFTAPTPAPYINLVQLDQLAEILGNVSVPVGTYTSATVTIAASSGDVLLTASADPTTGFAGTAATAVASSNIEVQGVQSVSGSQATMFTVNFVSPLVVTANQNNALDLEFDLSHPAFLIGHVPVGGGPTVWALNFNGPVRHHPIHDITRLVLRDIYGTVTGVSSSAITITKDFPVEPPTNPETAIASARSLQIQADATNGTLLYNVDAKTNNTVMNFSANSNLTGQFVRVSARYQQDGTLVGVRVYASSSFNSVWLSPEGHVLHVNTNTGVITVENEAGAGVPITVNANTDFYFRTPANAQADANPIGVGPSFLANHNFVRGFKVHVSVVDPLATPLVAQNIDIERAEYSGFISAPTMTNFTYNRVFPTVADGYVFPIDYISNLTANGNDPLTGNAIKGFKWWDFAFPTLVTNGTNAITNFISATNGAGVNFGGSVGSVPVWGTSDAIWGDPANSSGWAADNAILEPSPVPLGTVSASWSANATGGSFTMIAPPATGTNAVAIDITDTNGSATLVYQVARTSANIVTITPIDVTTQAGLATLASNMTGGKLVKVFGVPQASGGLQAYVLFYYAGTVMPAQ